MDKTHDNLEVQNLCNLNSSKQKKKSARKHEGQQDQYEYGEDAEYYDEEHEDVEDKTFPTEQPLNNEVQYIISKKISK